MARSRSLAFGGIRGRTGVFVLAFTFAFALTLVLVAGGGGRSRSRRILTGALGSRCGRLGVVGLIVEATLLFVLVAMFVAVRLA